jgi:hypothetical protein
MCGFKHVPRERVALSEGAAIRQLPQKQAMKFAICSGAGIIILAEELEPTGTWFDAHDTHVTNSATSVDVSFLRASSSLATR